MADGLVWESHPELRTPMLVAAFEGWNDAADAASAAADWLIAQGGAQRFAWIDSEEHVDYQSHRPTIHLVDGVASSITWPSTECFAARFPERDLVVVRGIEPNVSWKSFCRSVLTVARETESDTVVTFGALLGDVPHTRAAQVTGVASDASLASRLGVTRSRYEGPTGIVGVLNTACRDADVPSASLWTSVPHYLSTPPNPLCTRALLDTFGTLAGMSLELSAFDGVIATWRAEVDRALEDNDDVRRYVAELEERIDREVQAASEAEDRESLIGHDVPSGDALVKELEQFLREQSEGQ